MKQQQDYEDYEDIVRDVVEKISKLADGGEVGQVKSGRKNLWPGKSGHEHQIDISVEGANSLFLVECKCWNKTIPIEQVLVFFGRIYDIKQVYNGNICAAVATTKGLQSGAKLFAECYNIDLAVVKNAGEFVVKYRDQIMLSVIDHIRVRDEPNVEVR